MGVLHQLNKLGLLDFVEWLVAGNDLLGKERIENGLIEVALLKYSETRRAERTEVLPEPSAPAAPTPL